MDEVELQSLYQWVDEVPFSRPKRNIARDFSDGVLMAELAHHYFPKLVELHNYSGSQSVAQKVYNWNTLDRRVFRKLNFVVTKEEIQDVANSVPGAIEKLLSNFRLKVLQTQQRREHLMLCGVIGSARSPTKLSSTAPSTAAPSDPFPGLTSPSTEISQYAALPAQPAHHSSRGLPQQHPQQQQSHSTKEVLAEKDTTITEMRETIEILEVKIRKLEQLVKIKDQKLALLQQKLDQQQPTRTSQR